MGGIACVSRGATDDRFFWNNELAAGWRLGNARDMNPGSRAHGHRRYSRRGRLQTVVFTLAALLLLLLVAGLFWLLSSPRFVKPY